MNTPPPTEELFYTLDPELILSSVEELGLRATGKLLALNSFENRVYQVEIETDAVSSPFDRYRVAKFYRPGRWSKEQILEEHAFLNLLHTAGVPVVAPLTFPDGLTLHTTSLQGLFFCVYPKFGGRHSPELRPPELKTLGRLLAQIHIMGQQLPKTSRLRLNGETYGRSNLEYVLESGFLPKESEASFRSIAEPLIHHATHILSESEEIRLHGDLHLGNILWLNDSPWILDFDDMVYGPAIQDLWLVNPGRDDESRKREDLLIEGYTELRHFNERERRCIEPLRALRILHFEAWIAKRWNDPAFPRVFEQFGTAQYWREELSALQEISDILQSSSM